MNILTLIIHDLLYMLSPKSILVILSLILAAKSYSQNAAEDTLSFKLNDKAREMIGESAIIIKSCKLVGFATAII